MTHNVWSGLSTTLHCRLVTDWLLLHHRYACTQDADIAVAHELGCSYAANGKHLNPVCACRSDCCV